MIMEMVRSYKLRTEVLLLFEDTKDSLEEDLQIYNYCLLYTSDAADE